MHFNELIPPSMLCEPLPLNLWPNLWKAIEPEAHASCAAVLTPVRLLVAALGLDRATPLAEESQKPDP